MTDPQDAIPRVRVSLGGKNGAGRSMLIDRADWDSVREALGEHWGLLRGSDGKDRVCTSRKDALQAAGEWTSGPILFLSRWLLKPTSGKRVWFADGDPTNLTRSNLSTNRNPMLCGPNSDVRRRTVVVEAA
jgi:hypothetical protein